MFHKISVYLKIKGTILGERSLIINIVKSGMLEVNIIQNINNFLNHNKISQNK